jgi:predicted aldo/keto reductase-like oxidoreductase
MGIIAMKVYFRGFASRIPGFSGMEPFFRFALSQPVTTAVIGCDDLRQLEENVSFAASFTPMTHEEQDKLSEFVAPYARQLMYYKP